MEIIVTNPWVPLEWIAAHGFTPRGIWSLAEATEPAAEGVCAFAQMARSQAERREVPVIFTTACDQMRRAADAAGTRKSEIRNPKSEGNPKPENRKPKIAGACPVEFDHGANQENFGLRTSDFGFPSDFDFRISDFSAASSLRTFLFNLPSTWQTPSARRLYHAEVMRLGKFLLRLGGTAPTAAALEAAMLEQEKRRAELRRLADTAPAREAAEAASGSAGVPIALVGGPLCASQRGIFDAIESAGGRVVLNATEPGERCLLPPIGAPASGPAAAAPISNLKSQISNHQDAGPEAGAPLLGRLCDHYFDNIVDVFQRPNSRLYNWLGARLAARGVRGIVLWVHIGCDLWRAEAASLREAFGLPVLTLDAVDVRGVGLRDLTRLSAFVESLRGTPASGPAAAAPISNLKSQISNHRNAGPEAGAPMCPP